MERMSRKRFKKNLEFFKEYTLLCDKELEVMVMFMGTTYSMCCRCHIKITHISAGISFWSYVEWNFLAYWSEFCIPLTFQSPVVGLHTTRFNIKEFFMVLTLRLCISYRSQNKNVFCHIRINRLVLYNQGGECLLHGTHKVPV